MTKYKAVSDENLNTAVNDLRLRWTFTLQQDKDSKPVASKPLSSSSTVWHVLAAFVNELAFQDTIKFGKDSVMSYLFELVVLVQGWC